MHLRTSWAVVALGTVSVGRARAEPDPAALSLYDEGRRLYDDGKFDKACPKFEASLQLNPEDLGTRGMFALCLEGAGRLASAWSQFRDVKVRAVRASNAKAAKVAEGHIVALGPRLAKITLHVSSPDLAHLVVKKDDVVVSADTFGVPLAVDRGSHTFSAEAPGFEPWSKQRSIEDGEEQTIEIPVLDPVPAVPEVVAAPRPAASNPWRAMFYGSAAVTVAGVGVWIYGYHEIDDAELGLCSGAHVSDCNHPPPTDPATAAQLDRQGHRGDSLSLAGKIATFVGGGFALLALYEGFVVKRPVSRPRGHDLALIPVGLGAELSGSW